MSFIDLNSNNFETKSFKPLNGGEAGIVEGISIASIDKYPDTNKWVITYGDDSGGILRDFYSYVEPDGPDYEKRLKAQGITLRHLWKEAIGSGTLPTFRTSIEMLDSIMTHLKNHSKGKTFRLTVDYGTDLYHATNLQRRKFVPFIENSSVEKTALFMSRNAKTTPATPNSQDELMSKVRRDISEIDLVFSKKDTGNEWLE